MGPAHNRLLNDDTTEKDFVKYLYSMALGIEEFENLTITKDRPHVSARTCAVPTRGEQAINIISLVRWGPKSSVRNMLNESVTIFVKRGKKLKVLLRVNPSL
jgi:hypothetical protein